MKLYCLLILVFFSLSLFSQSWEPLDVEIPHQTNVDPKVNVLSEFQDKLYVGGTNFREGIDFEAVVVWDDVSFSFPNFNITALLDHTIFSMEVINNQLYLAGDFSTVDGDLVDGVIAYDGQAWTEQGDGMPIFDILALTEYNNELYAGGFTTIDGKSIVKLSNDEWINPIGLAYGWVVHDLVVYNNTLYIASILGIHSYDGQTFNHIFDPEFPSRTYTLEVIDGNLIAGGRFVKESGTTYNHVVRYDGTTWETIGEGVDFEVLDIIEYDNKIFVCGVDQNDDGASAVWDGSSWINLNMLDDVARCFSVYNGTLYMGGDFTNGIVKLSGITTNHELIYDDPTITIFPNPASDILMVQTQTNEPYEVKVIDVTGKTLLTEDSTEQINISSLSRGSYMIEIITSTSVFVSKFIKL